MCWYYSRRVHLKHLTVIQMCWCNFLSTHKNMNESWPCSIESLQTSSIHIDNSNHLGWRKSISVCLNWKAGHCFKVSPKEAHLNVRTTFLEMLQWGHSCRAHSWSSIIYISLPLSGLKVQLSLICFLFFLHNNLNCLFKSVLSPLWDWHHMDLVCKVWTEGGLLFEEIELEDGSPQIPLRKLNWFASGSKTEYFYYDKSSMTLFSIVLFPNCILLFSWFSYLCHGQSIFVLLLMGTY